MAIAWTPIAKYSAVALTSGCIATGICFSTHDKLEEGEKEELQPENIEDLEEDKKPLEQEDATVKIEKLTKAKKEAEAKNFRYFLKFNCYENEIKRQLNIGSRWWYGDRVDELVKKCEQYKINS